jgi:uncharacterized protein YjbI with pentapeptide repeats
LRGANLEGAYLQGVSLSGAKLGGVQNLRQDQLNGIIFESDSPPVNLPDGLKLPAHRAFIIEEKKGRFVKSKKPESGRLVSEVLEEEQQELEKAKASKKT